MLLALHVLEENLFANSFCFQKLGPEKSQSMSKAYNSVWFASSIRVPVLFWTPHLANSFSKNSLFVRYRHPSFGGESEMQSVQLSRNGWCALSYHSNTKLGIDSFTSCCLSYLLSKLFRTKNSSTIEVTTQLLRRCICRKRQRVTKNSKSSRTGIGWIGPWIGAHLRTWNVTYQ